MSTLQWTEWKRANGFDFPDIMYEKKYLLTGGGVARITFNKPEKLNPFTIETWEEVHQCIQDANKDHSIGVIVITGAGDRAFCTGADSSVETSPEAMDEALEATLIDDYVRRSRKPLIAAVKGYAIGGGNHLAYCCDFTIAADNAIFAQVGPRIGSPANGYVVTYLARVVGAKRAREIWMLCRQYTAQQALEMGLVNTVVPLDKFDEEVDRWCEEILEKSPTIIALIKASFDNDTDYMDGSYGRLLRQMAPEFVGSEEHKEAMQANIERRKPNFWKSKITETD